MDKEQIKKLINAHLKEGEDERGWCRASMDAYLDIETTGLSPSSAQITIVGIYLIKGTIERLVQIVGNDITAVLSISKMGHFINRRLCYHRAA